jgi:hypothetical protein
MSFIDAITFSNDLSSSNCSDHYSKIIAALKSSKFFTFDPMEIGVSCDGSAIVSVCVRGYANIVDTTIAQQLHDLGFEGTVWYIINGNTELRSHAGLDETRFIDASVSVGINFI